MPLKDIALTFVPQLGLRGAAYLINYFGSAEAVYAASREELVEGAMLREEAARNILSQCGMREAEREMLYCQRNGVTPIGHLLLYIRDFCAKRRIFLWYYMSVAMWRP